MSTPESYAAGPRLESPAQSPVQVLGVALLAVIVVMLMVLMVQVMDLKTARTETDRDLAEIQSALADQQGALEQQREALDTQQGALDRTGEQLDTLGKIVSFEGEHADAASNPIARAIDRATDRGDAGSQPVTAPIPEWMHTPPTWWTEGPPWRDGNGSNGNNDNGDNGDTGTDEGSDTGGNGSSDGNDTGDNGAGASRDLDTDNGDAQVEKIPVRVYVTADIDLDHARDAVRRFNDAVGNVAELEIFDLTPEVFEQLDIDPRLPDDKVVKCLTIVLFPGEDQAHWAASENGDAIIQIARRIVLHFNPHAFNGDAGDGGDNGDGETSDAGQGEGDGETTDDGSTDDPRAAMLALATDCATRFLAGLAGDREALLAVVDFTAVRAGEAHGALLSDAQVLVEHYASATGFALVSVDPAHEQPGIALSGDDRDGWTAGARWSYARGAATGHVHVEMRYSERDEGFRVVAIRDALLVDEHTVVTIVRGDWVYTVTRAALRGRAADWIPGEGEFVTRHNRRPAPDPVPVPTNDHTPTTAHTPGTASAGALARVARVRSTAVGTSIALDVAGGADAGACFVVRGRAGDAAIVCVTHANGDRATARIVRLLGAGVIEVGDAVVIAPDDVVARAERRERTRPTAGGR